MQIQSPSNFYKYFKECYKADFKESFVENALLAKYKFKWFAKTEELISEHLPIIPYPNTKLEELQSELKMYSLEKELFYGCFFLLGKVENTISKNTNLCSPLVLYPAQIIDKNGNQFLSLDFENFKINTQLLSKIEFENTNARDEFSEELAALLVSDYDLSAQLPALFSKYASAVNTDFLTSFPECWNQTKIKKCLKTLLNEDLLLAPIAGTILVEKSDSSLGVLNDLDDLVESNELPNSINDLLSESRFYPGSEESHFKSFLNGGQYRSIINSQKFISSAMIGPPGTGKSFTIAAMVANALIQDESVLVVSKTKHAVEVVRNMLLEQYNLGSSIIHTTSPQYKRILRTKIRHQLSGLFSARSSNKEKTLLASIQSTAKITTAKFTDLIERELKHSNLITKEDSLSLVEKWTLFISKVRGGRGEQIWEMFTKINGLNKNHHQALKRFIDVYSREVSNKNGNKYRRDLAQYAESISAKNFTSYKTGLEQISYANLVKVFPIWLANLSDLNRVLPFQANLFDLVIIDEATQCDIATALPAIYRAKKVVVSGDPNQLRHYSFVSKSFQSIKRKEFGLEDDLIYNYRDKSILDVYLAKIQHQKQVSFLKEHFRSTPSLIEFSNREFYNGELQVVKSTPEFLEHKHIELVQVNGARNSKGVNAVEIEKVIQIVKKIIHEHLDSHLKPSLGVLSPFASQVKAINNALKDNFTAKELASFQLKAATPYQFQGSEREIVVFSFCVCKETHSSAYFHLNKPEVFNVGITRAKSYQYVVSSVLPSELKQNSLLYKYLEFIKSFENTKVVGSYHDEFLAEVVEFVSTLDVQQVSKAYPLAGNVLDLLVVVNDKNYFIDLIGYPGDFQEAFSFERYNMLARAGVISVPLQYSFWSSDKEKVKMYISKSFGIIAD